MGKVYEVTFEIIFKVEAENEDEALDIAYGMGRSEAISDFFENVKEVN